ncbi:MAG: proteasome assembly chaperone family protein [Candidatus Aenigmarchaeota archaeon]|nr:proteasome assembly chaperone family protein [Candidatus Aenigmarchaeota archaeon]
METMIKVTEKVKLKKPILIEGLPGIGNVGRVAAGYLVGELKMKKFAELYSPYFLPLVILHQDSVAHLLKCEFYYYRGKKNDIVVLTGDTQSISSEGHYDVCNAILDFSKKIGVTEIITLGGFVAVQEIKEPRVIGAVNDKKLLKKYAKYGIDFNKEHPVGSIVGASGLLLGLGNIMEIPSLCLMGETIGLPMITDPKAADKILQVLLKILDLKLDLGKLEKIIKEMEVKINKTDTIHKEILEGMPKPKDDVKYIG